MVLYRSLLTAGEDAGTFDDLGIGISFMATLREGTRDDVFSTRGLEHKLLHGNLIVCIQLLQWLFIAQLLRFDHFLIQFFRHLEVLNFESKLLLHVAWIVDLQDEGLPLLHLGLVDFEARLERFVLLDRVDDELRL